MPAQNLPGLVLDRAHPLSRGLVGWWPLNEGGGIRANDLVAGNAGTLTNGPTARGSVLGAARAFDGSDDHLIIPHSPALAITTDITIACWALTTTISGWRQFLDKGPNPTTHPAPYQIGQYDGTGQIYFGRGNGSSSTSLTSTSAAVAGAWTFWVCTWAGGTFRIYYNGRIDASSSASPTCTDAGHALYVGQREDMASAYWSGAFAHLRIYNRAVDAREVAQLYADPLAGAFAPVRASRYYTAPTADPPAVPTRPLSADRLNNRTYARIFRRGETG